MRPELATDWSPDRRRIFSQPKHLVTIRWKLSADGRILTGERDEPRQASSYKRCPVKRGALSGEQGTGNESSRPIKWSYDC